MVCGATHKSRLKYEEGSEEVCGGADMPNQTSDTTEHNSEVGINFGVMDAHGHTTLHYIPQQVPQPEITTHYTPAAFTSDFTYEHQIEEGESMSNSCLPIVAAENPPPTQEFVSGRITEINMKVCISIDSKQQCTHIIEVVICKRAQLECNYWDLNLHPLT